MCGLLSACGGGGAAGTTNAQSGISVGSTATGDAVGSTATGDTGVSPGSSACGSANASAFSVGVIVQTHPSAPMELLDTLHLSDGRIANQTLNVTAVGAFQFA